VPRLRGGFFLRGWGGGSFFKGGFELSFCRRVLGLWGGFFLRGWGGGSFFKGWGELPHSGGGLGLLHRLRCTPYGFQRRVFLRQSLPLSRFDMGLGIS
jgi:hypothetical protein